MRGFEERMIGLQRVRNPGAALRVALVLGSLAGMVLAAGAGSQWFFCDWLFW